MRPTPQITMDFLEYNAASGHFDGRVRISTKNGSETHALSVDAPISAKLADITDVCFEQALARHKTGEWTSRIHPVSLRLVAKTGATGSVGHLLDRLMGRAKAA